MYQYQQGQNGQAVKIQGFRTFLQTNTVRPSDTDKIHFSHCWLRLCQLQANISSLNLGETFYRLTYSPTLRYLKFPPGPILRNCGLQPYDMMQTRGHAFFSTLLKYLGQHMSFRIYELLFRPLSFSRFKH